MFKLKPVFSFLIVAVVAASTGVLAFPGCNEFSGCAPAPEISCEELCVRMQPQVCKDHASYVRTDDPKVEGPIGFWSCVCPIENSEKFEFLIPREPHNPCEHTPGSGRAVGRYEGYEND